MGLLLFVKSISYKLSDIKKPIKTTLRFWIHSHKYVLCYVLGDPTLILVPCGRKALLICGEPTGLLTGPPSARLISGEKAGPLTGVVGADSDCLLRISSANHTLLFPLGGVPEEKM